MIFPELSTSEKNGERENHRSEILLFPHLIYLIMQQEAIVKLNYRLFSPQNLSVPNQCDWRLRMSRTSFQQTIAQRDYC